jgi:folate-binding protein YgfZ
MALEQLRVEAGVPAFGADFDEQHFPQETGLESQAVSYTKGCYLGQEIVARIHYRGKANHALRQLRFDAGPPPPGGTPPGGTRLLFDGQEVGRVGSAVAPLDGGAPVGLAVLHRKGGEPGTRLEVEGFGTAEVLPSATD